MECKKNGTDIPTEIVAQICGERELHQEALQHMAERELHQKEQIKESAEKGKGYGKQEKGTDFADGLKHIVQRHSEESAKTGKEREKEQAEREHILQRHSERPPDRRENEQTRKIRT